MNDHEWTQNKWTQNNRLDYGGELIPVICHKCGMEAYQDTRYQDVVIQRVLLGSIYPLISTEKDCVFVMMKSIMES